MVGAAPSERGTVIAGSGARIVAPTGAVSPISWLAASCSATKSRLSGVPKNSKNSKTRPSARALS